jgi:hypothetical protein
MEQRNTLNRPLPPEVVFLNHGLFTRYRMYPTFSAPWMRGRFLLFVALVGGFSLLVLSQAILSGSAWGPALNATSATLFSFLLMLFVGPGLALLVRHARWKAQQEAIGVVLAVFVGVLLSAWIDFHASAYIEAQTGKNPHVVAQRAQLQQPSEVKQVLAHALNATTNLAIYSLLGGGFALIGYFRERVRLAASLRRRELGAANAARREAEMKLSVLQAQVEPHFLFNTFAGLRGLIRSDPERAVQLLDRLVDYLRASIPQLRASGSEAATLGAQVDMVRAYLALMRVRMGTRLSFHIDVPADLREAHFPPLMLISLTENAIKHGLEPKPEGGSLTINATVSNGELQVTVRDDGVGFGGNTSGSGIGLANIRARLLQMYGDKARLELKARAEGGVQASISLPVHQA